jgi:hypothetical protein
MVWTATHIMFTGSPFEGADATRFSPSGITIDNAGEQTLTLHLMDINLNPIAANKDTDEVEFRVEGASISGSSDVKLVKSMGVKFTDAGNIIGSSFDEDRTYQVTLEDKNHSPGSPTEPVTLRTQVKWTPAPRFEGYSPTNMSADLTEVSGWSD